MSRTLACLRALADPTRLRLLAILNQGEFSVNELRQITCISQPCISTHLRILKETGLLNARRVGKNAFYSLNSHLETSVADAVKLALQGATELPDYQSDQLNLKQVLLQRQTQSHQYFNRIAGRFGRIYGPGRSWEAFGHLLLRILPPYVVADLGSGEGLMAELLARKCKKVIAVDNSKRIVEFGKKRAQERGISNLEFRWGDLQDPPIEPETVDVVILSQALHHADEPTVAIKNAFKILRPSGQIVILDLEKHKFTQAKALYGDKWLGFREGELHQWLEEAGFTNLEVSIVAREPDPPHFATILAYGVKPSSLC